MALPIFRPPRNPDVGLHSQDRVRRRVIRLGDGYTKRETEGINAIDRIRTLTWSALTQADYDAILGFFEGIGTGAFYYAIPGQPTYKWTPVEWSHGHRSGTLYSITVTLEGVFDYDEP